MNQNLNKARKETIGNDNSTKITIERIFGPLDRYDYWKFCESRAQQVRNDFWKIGTWLIAILFGLIAFLFKSDCVNLQNKLVVTNKVNAISISLIGLLFSLVSMAILIKIFQHMVKNYERAGKAKNSSKKVNFIKSLRLDSILIFVTVVIFVLSFTTLFLWACFSSTTLPN